MAAEVLVGQLEQIKRLDEEGYHWFCPRTSPSDPNLFYDEDLLDQVKNETQQEKERRHKAIAEAESRRETAIAASEILAYSDATSYQETFKDGLKHQLQRCDVCIREFHRSRARLRSTLEESHDSDEVAVFMQTFDDMNISRIASGLKSMTENLLDLPPDQRSIATAGDEGMYALFESLHCIPFLRDENLLREHLDQPFKMVQSKKKLKIPAYAPGMAAFLFSHEELRSSWAYRNMNSIKRPLTGPEFEYGVKPFLESSMHRVNVLSLEMDFLPTFWKGVHQILSKMTKEVLSAHIRSLEPNLYTLAMEHWQLDASHFADMTACYTILLTLSPADFWDAMGGINGQHVVENILRSPVLQRLLRETREEVPLHLEEKLSWVLPFMKSMKPANLVPPTRAMLDQLLKEFQDENKGYSRYAKRICWSIGLQALLCALQRARTSLRGDTVVVHLVEIVSKDHIHNLMQELDGIEKKTELQVD
ncbi:hypothetical protein KC331_g19979, partial [Hortaea werneckii]